MMFLKLKLAIRNLLKNKLFSSINISGLVIGIASFMVIALYVGYELSYDRFYSNSDNIYRVYMDYKKGNQFEEGDAQVYNLSGPTLKNEFPEIIDYVRLFQLKKSTFEFENSVFEIKNGYLADPSWFRIFDFPLIQGNPAKVLNDPNTVVLSHETAKKIFGDIDPLGKMLAVYERSEKIILTVSGVLKDIPENTSMKTNFLVSFQTLKNWKVTNPQELNWNNNDYFTYILVDKNTNISDLGLKIKNLDLADKKDERHNIEPLTKIHLYSDKPFEAEVNGNIVQVRLLLIMAIFILLLSWLNYINLSSSKSIDRTREVGVRKVAGANRRQLVFQFLFESFLLYLVAILLASGIVAILLPYLNIFIGKSLNLNFLSGSYLFFLIGVPVLGVIISGFYPAFSLSGYNPISMLKGKISGIPTSLTLRNVFVIIQFMTAIILLIGSITIFKQMNFMSEQPLGVDLNQVISIKSNIIEENPNLGIAYPTLKEKLKKLPFVESVSITQTFPGSDNRSYFSGMTYPDGTREAQTKWYFAEVDQDYQQVLSIEMKAGQIFSEQESANQRKVIINETAAQKLGFSEPAKAVDQTIKFWGNSWLISGVMKDYHFSGLKYYIDPFILRYNEGDEYSGILVKLNNMTSLSGVDNAISQLEKEWKQMFPKSSFQYQFADEKFAALYDNDRKFGKAFGFFTFLSIFIASLGLFGLTFYNCMLRIKEVGIRKVNGANISEILVMLNRDFIKWIVVAFVLATPIAWYAMHRWLENFAYKTTLSWWIFALAGVLALGIALLTVSWQSWKAATRNPVEALRYE